MSSKVSKMPIGRARRKYMKVAPIATFEDEFDLLTTIEENKSELTGEATINLLCPEISFMVLHDALLDATRQSDLDRFPKGASVAACLMYGLAQLFDSEPIKDYVRVSDTLSNDRDMSLHARMEIWTYIHNWKFLQRSPVGGLRQLKIRTSNYVRSTLTERTVEIGLPAYTLSSVALGIGLAALPNSPVEYTKHVDDSVEDLLTAVRAKLVVIDRMLSTLGVEV